MKNSTFQLNNKRILALMKIINECKIVNISKFLSSINISVASFNAGLKRIQKELPLEYENYKKIYDNNYFEYFETCKELISIMEEMMINGVIQDDGTVRKFDLLDWYKIYYSYFDGANRLLISKIIDERDRDCCGFKKRAVRIRQLISISSNQNLGSFYNNITAEHVLMDESYGLTLEEKNDIVNFFNGYSIPYNYDTFDCAAKRVINSRNQEQKTLGKFYRECFRINI